MNVQRVTEYLQNRLLVLPPGGKLPGIRIHPAGMSVRSISLMRSERGKRGMIYTELGTIEAQP